MLVVAYLRAANSRVKYLNIMGAFKYVKYYMSVIVWFPQYIAKYSIQGHYLLSMIQCGVKTYLLSHGLTYH